MDEKLKSKVETWAQEDDVIYDAIPISYAYPVDNTNEVRPSTSKRKRRTTKSASERKPRTTKSSLGKLSDDWVVTGKPRPDGTRVDKNYYHKTEHVTVRSVVSALFYQENGRLPPKKSKSDGNKD